MTAVRLTQPAHRELGEAGVRVRRTLLEVAQAIGADPTIGETLHDLGGRTTIRRLNPTDGYAIIYTLDELSDTVLVTAFAQPQLLTADLCAREAMEEQSRLAEDDVRAPLFGQLVSLAKRVKTAA